MCFLWASNSSTIWLDYWSRVGKSATQVDQKSYQTKHEKMMRQDNQRVRQSFPNPYRARGAGWPRANQRNRCGQGMCGRGSVSLPSKFLRFMNDEEKNKILCMGARGTCGFAGPCFISGPWTLLRGFLFCVQLIHE